MTLKAKPIPFRWVVRITAIGIACGMVSVVLMAMTPDEPDQRSVWIDRWFLVILPSVILGMLGMIFGAIFGVNESFRRYPIVTGRVFRAMICLAWILASVVAIRGVITDKSPPILAPSVDQSPVDVLPAPFSWSAATDVSPLDLLDPADIPLTERPLVPSSDVVAVFGNSRGRPWEPVGAMAIQPDGRRIATGDRMPESPQFEDALSPSVVRLWDTDTLRVVAELPVDGPGVNDLSFSRDGGALAIGRLGGIDLWDLTAATPAWMQTIDAPQVTSSMIAIPESLQEHPLGQCAFAPTADRLAVGWRKNRSRAVAYSVVQRYVPRHGRWEADGGWAVGHEGEDRSPVYALTWSHDSARLAVTAMTTEEPKGRDVTYILSLRDESEKERTDRLQWTVTIGWIHALWGVPIAWGLGRLVRLAARQPLPPPNPDFPAQSMSEIAAMQLAAASLAVVATLMLLKIDPVERAEYHVSVPVALFLSLFALAEAERHARWARWLRVPPLASLTLFAGMVAMYFVVAPWDLANPPGSRISLPVPGWLGPAVGGFLVVGLVAVGFGRRSGRRWARILGWASVGLAIAFADYALLASDSPPEWVASVTETPGGPQAFLPDGERIVVQQAGSIRVRHLTSTPTDPGAILNSTDIDGKWIGMDSITVSPEGSSVAQAGRAQDAYVGPIASGAAAPFPFPAGHIYSWSGVRFAVAGRTLATAAEGPQHLPELRVWDWSDIVPRSRRGPVDVFADAVAVRLSPDGRHLAEWRTKRTPAAITGILTLTDLTTTPPTRCVLIERPWPTLKGMPMADARHDFFVAFDGAGTRLQAWEVNAIEGKSGPRVVGSWRCDAGGPVSCPTVPADDLTTKIIYFEHSPDGQWVATLEESDAPADSSHAYRVVLQGIDKADRKVLTVVRPEHATNRFDQPFMLRFSTDSRTLTVCEKADEKYDSPYRPKVSWTIGASSVAIPVPTSSEWEPLSFFRKLSPDGRHIADWVEGKKYSRDHSRVRITDPAGNAVRDVQLPGPASHFEFAPDGRHLLTWNNNGTVSVVRLAAADPNRVMVARSQARLAVDPRDAIAYRHRAEALVRLGRYAEAKVSFIRAIDLEREEP